MGHVLVGQTSDTCAPFAVVGCTNHGLPYVTYSAEWCRAKVLLHLVPSIYDYWHPL
jgi:hypothetical protein